MKKFGILISTWVLASSFSAAQGAEMSLTEISDLQAQGYIVSKTMDLSAGLTPKASTTIPLTIFVQDTSTWNDQLITEQLLTAQAYYLEKCDIELFPLKAFFGNQAGWSFQLFYSGPEIHMIWPADQKPLNPFGRQGVFGFFIEQFDIAPTLTGFAQPLFYVGENSINLNTLFISKYTHIYETLYDPSYSVFIHELAHVLTNAPHLDDYGINNVISGSYQGLDITQEQCATIRSNFSALDN